jgi:DNA-directed RNA polymerase subunit RPC12/RpoP
MHCGREFLVPAKPPADSGGSSGPGQRSQRAPAAPSRERAEPIAGGYLAPAPAATAEVAIKFSCAQCGKKFTAQRQYAGRRSRCPDCGYEFQVPSVPDGKAVSIGPQAQPALPLVDDPLPQRAAAAPPSGTGEPQSSTQIALPELPVLGVTSAPVKARSLRPLWVGGAALVLFAAGGAGWWWWRTPFGTREIVERNEASVALIQGQAESRTGFLVRNNLLATNAHVIRIEITRDIQIFFPSAPKAEQGPYAARILYEDSKRDLAILRVNVGLPVLTLAQSYAFRRGDDVTIIGNPGLGGHVTLQNAIAKGVMSTETTLEGQRFRCDIPDATGYLRVGDSEGDRVWRHGRRRGSRGVQRMHEQGFHGRREP